MRIFITALLCGAFMLPTSAYADIKTAYQALTQGQYDIARESLVPLAKKGDAQAQYYLGYMYEKGTGFSVDYATALEWYGKAAKKGHVESLLKLAWMAENGIGTPLNYERAFGHYMEAAEAGHAKAMGRVGQYYLDGYGTFPDLGQALVWLKKAVEGGDPKAQAMLDELERRGMKAPENLGTQTPSDPIEVAVLKEAGDFFEEAGFAYRVTSEISPYIMQKEEGLYRVSLPKAFIETPHGQRLRVGTLRLDIKPLEMPLYEFSIVLPGAMRLLDTDGAVRAYFTLGGQELKLSWNGEKDQHSQLDARYTDVGMKGAGAPFGVTIEDLTFNRALTPETANLYRMENSFQLSDLALNFSGGMSAVKIASIAVSGTASGFDPVLQKQYAEETQKRIQDMIQQQAQAAGGKKAARKKQALPPLLPAMFGDTNGKMDVAGIEVSLMIGTEPVRLDRMSFSGGLNGFDLDTGSVDFAVLFDGLAVPEAMGQGGTPKPAPPRKMALDIQLANFSLRKLLNELIKVGHGAMVMQSQMAGAGQGGMMAPQSGMMMGMMMLPQLDQHVRNAGVQVKLKNMEVDADLYGLKSAGTIVVKEELSADIDLTVRGLPYLVKNEAERKAKQKAEREAMMAQMKAQAGPNATVTMSPSSDKKPLFAHLLEVAEKTGKDADADIQQFKITYAPATGVLVNGEVFVPPVPQAPQLSDPKGPPLFDPPGLVPPTN